MRPELAASGIEYPWRFAGQEPPFAFHAFADVEEQVREDVAAIRESSLLVHRDSVRGFVYGSKVAPAFWAAQMDVTPFGGALRPVFFIDAGQAERAGDLFSSRVLVGGGVGLSVYSRLLRANLLRVELSRPFSQDHGDDWRFDLRFQVPR